MANGSLGNIQGLGLDYGGNKLFPILEYLLLPYKMAANSKILFQAMVLVTLDRSHEKGEWKTWICGFGQKHRIQDFKVLGIISRRKFVWKTLLFTKIRTYSSFSGTQRSPAFKKQCTCTCGLLLQQIMPFML